MHSVACHSPLQDPSELNKGEGDILLKAEEININNKLWSFKNRKENFKNANKNMIICINKIISIFKTPCSLYRARCLEIYVSSIMIPIEII